ncbi:hypothetical protein SCLARK_001877 [Spiroplasma clarkii]|nr:hypothetical protein [Spiroplasma clarkii]ARU92307.1 hypothetical protein SCLARK_001877 [Spiroplasma clarkii]
MNGSVVLQKIKLEINKDYSIDLNPVTMKWILAVSGEKWDKNKSLNQTQLGDAMYFNTAMGIKSYLDVLGVKPSTKSIESAELGNPKVFLTATGGSGSGNNIWTDLNGWVIHLSIRNSYIELHNILSLKTDKLSDKRQLLLTQGYQGVFELLIWGVDKDGQVTFNTNFFNYTITGKNEGNQLTVGNTSGDPLKVAFNLRLNFIDVTFILDYSNSSPGQKLRNQLLMTDN